VIASSVDHLAELVGPVRTSQRDADFILQPPAPDMRCTKLVVFLNGREPAFGDPVQAVVTLARPHLPTPLYAGIKFEQQSPIGGESVVVIGGWNPVTALKAEAPASFLWLMGE
jgi:hypothetical protein